MNDKIDIELIANTALGHAKSLVQDWLPNGKREGAEWVSINPGRADKNKGSFKVNLNSGKWSDFATVEKGGGDLVSLYAYLNKTSQLEAAKAVANLIGMTVVDLLPRMKQKIPIVPVPSDAPECMFKHPKYGSPTKMWPYHDADGNLAFYRARFDFMKDGKPDKAVLPITYCDIGNGKCAWRSKDIPGLKPLYNLPQLLSRPDVDVIVVEGEKAADAAQILFHGMVVTTWSGGGKAYEKTDWSYLKGRKVFLWPDADSPGFVTIIGLTAYLQEKFKS